MHGITAKSGIFFTFYLFQANNDSERTHDFIKQVKPEKSNN